MSNRVIPIRTNRDKIFLEFLKVGKSFFEAYMTYQNNKDKERDDWILVTLNKRELEVLSALLYLTFKKPGDNIVSTENKEYIRERININVHSLNNNIKSLRDKNILIENRVAAIFIINPVDDEYNVNFKFQING